MQTFRSGPRLKRVRTRKHKLSSKEQEHAHTTLHTRVCCMPLCPLSGSTLPLVPSEAKKGQPGKSSCDAETVEYHFDCRYHNHDQEDDAQELVAQVGQ